MTGKPGVAVRAASALRSLLFPGALLAAAALAAAASPAALEYRREPQLLVEIWRLVTCHWVHWSAEHLRWDLLTLLALAWACRQEWRRALASLAAATVAIPLVIAALQPELASYRGLSGLASTLFVLVACELLIGSTGRWVSLAAVLALAAFAAKLLWELTTGQALFVDAGASFVPVPLAHLVGGICGAAAAFAHVSAHPQEVSCVP